MDNRQRKEMNLALMLHHGPRADSPNEVMSYPHMELLASNPAERERLRILANQLEAFGSVPFSFKEMESIDHSQQGTVMRIALCERPVESK
jgi:hypothetical protein